MNGKILLITALLIISYNAIAQFRFDKRYHSNNYVDPLGRKQGFWTVKDADSLLLNKAHYSNNIADTIVYFRKNGESIILLRPDTSAYPINYAALDSEEHKMITMEAFLTRCNASVVYLIEASGLVAEIRFINSCSKKLEKRIRRYLKPIAFKPARLNGKSIVSQAVFNFGRGG